MHGAGGGALKGKLIEDRDFARSLDDAAAAVAASAAIMKLHGLGSEKVKVETQSVLHYLTDLSRRDIPVEASTRYTLARPIFNRLAISLAPNPSLLSFRTAPTSIVGFRPW
jgi:hypothetical protein